MELDKWQEDVLEAKGNIVVCSGRQCGKSTVIAMKAGDYALKHPNKSIMVIAAVERQALLLFEKILSHIYLKSKGSIKKGRDKPTKHELRLTNGSVLRCLPTGDSGYGIRGYTIDQLYADEAHFIKPDVWSAVTPMLATTGGDIILLSTPFGTEGYFYDCFHSDKFTKFHVSTVEVADKRENKALQEFLKDEKERMSKLQFQQEYEALFVGGIMRLFSDELIQKCMLQEDDCKTLFHTTSNRFLGIDLARFGGDETVLSSFYKDGRGTLKMFDLDIPEPQMLTYSARLIIHKHAQYNYRKIYVDTGGMGIGVFDMLLEDPTTKRRVVSIDNSRRSIDKEKGRDSPRLKVNTKEDLYQNLLRLMENGEIFFFDKPELEQSFRSITYEYAEDRSGRLIITGNYSHIVEAIIRAAWAVKDKTLTLWAR